MRALLAGRTRIAIPQPPTPRRVAPKLLRSRCKRLPIVFRFTPSRLFCFAHSCESDAIRNTALIYAAWLTSSTDRALIICAFREVRLKSHSGYSLHGSRSRFEAAARGPAASAATDEMALIAAVSLTIACQVPSRKHRNAVATCGS
jgi:hypothetical protein